MTSRSSRYWQHPALTEAVKLLRARKGKPSDVDRPPVKPAPGRKPKLHRGQLDFFGGEEGREEEAAA
jgi:hypothetical protein